MNKTVKSIFIIILTCFVSSIYSIDPDFKHLTPLDGLNNGTINDMIQDKYGQMWFATWDGVMRYDGYFIKNYKPVMGDSLSIPAKQVSHLFIDSRDNIWMVSMHGICRYDQSMDNFKIYTLEGISGEDFLSSRIQEIDSVIVISCKGSLFYVEIESIHSTRLFRKLQILDSLNNPIVSTIRDIKSIQNEIWLNIRLSPPMNVTYSKMMIGRINMKDSVTCVIHDQFEFNGNITSISPFNEKQFFVGTAEGLYLFNSYDKSHRLVKSTDDLNITNLLVTSDNKLWIGTNNSGLACLNLHNDNFSIFTHDPHRANSILGNVVFSLFEDFSGNLWIGFGGEGLSKLNLRQKPFETYRHDPNNEFSLSTNTILCFNEFGKDVLIGTLYDGLVLMKRDINTGEPRFESMTMPSHFIPKNENYIVWNIYKEADSLYWLGTNIGLIKATHKAGRWEFDQVLIRGLATIRQIFIDKSKNLWLGCLNGLFLIPYSRRETMEYYHYSTAENNPYSLSDKVITSIFLDKSDNFWIGTQSGGLNLLKVKYQELDLTGKDQPKLDFQHFNFYHRSDSSMNNNEINVIYEHPDGSLWIGTQGGGINILDLKTRRFRYITVEDGLAGDDVFSLLPDGEGNLWITTNKGLSCYNLYSGKFNNYTPVDGIQGNVFMLNSYFRSESGKLYFGGRNGFTCFEPAGIIHNTIPPKIIFSGLKIFNKEVGIGETINGRVLLSKALTELSSITLTHKDNYFSVRFSVIHFINPDENKAEYILEGFDKEWIRTPAFTEFITYNNLPHGSYKLKIKGGNPDNTWADEVRELDITILPPWYLTWWAKLVFFLAGASALAGLMLLILHRQSLKHMLKIEKMEFENLKELNEEKLRFFTNISHELRTPLSLTIAPIEELILKKDYSESFVQKQINLAHRNAKLLIRLINQIIDFRKLNAGKLQIETDLADVSILLKEVVKNFEVFRTEKEIDLSLAIAEESFYIRYDSQKMEQVFYNLLSNAFKFTPRGGRIEIILEKIVEKAEKEKNSWLKISIYNDGKEIPHERLEQIFERFYKIDSNSEGSGIGLSYTKSLIEMHNGKIIVEPVVGKGNRFIVYLPCDESDSVRGESTNLLQESRVTEKISKPEEILSDLAQEEIYDDQSKLSILLIEDNNELRDFLKSHFESEFCVLEAPDGSEGLKIAEEAIPDIIVSDIVMPGMDGLELCERLKKHSKTCHIPVILLTAKDTTENKRFGYDHGADAYVTKPFEVSVLDSQIKAMIRNRELIHENYRSQNFMIDISSNEVSRDDLFIAKLKALIEENISDVNFNVKNLSSLLLLSNSQVYRKINALTGYSPVEFIRVIRVMKAAEILRSTNMTVKEVCFKTGFNNPSYFIKCFKEHFKVTPNVYMNESQTT